MLERNKEGYYRKTDLCNFPIHDKDGKIIGEATGILNVSIATFDRWRVKYPDFPKSANPNPNGVCLFKRAEIHDWLARHPEL